MKSELNGIDADVRGEVIQNLFQKLKQFYVFPDVADDICKHLQKQTDEGVYKDIADGELFAFALTTHMQEVNLDKHLWVRWYDDPLPDDEGSLLQNKQKMAELKLRARLKNYGIFKVERLPGNVGYLDIRYFYRTSWGSGATIVAALNFLANMNAVIVDLRKCGGGNPAAVAMISSYFFDEEPIHLNTLHWRENNVSEQYWTLPFVPGTRLIEQPVYILTSSKTFSAGEEFSYNLQSLRRAIIVGETTAGGAHPGSPYRLHDHFEVFIPNGRAINPITNQNWEGVGIQPDISISQEQALNVAYQTALNSIIEEIKQQESKPFCMLLEEAATALQNIGGKLIGGE